SSFCAFDKETELFLKYVQSQDSKYFNFIDDKKQLSFCISDDQNELIEIYQIDYLHYYRLVSTSNKEHFVMFLSCSSIA
ncbi:MAG: hypothetical protein EBS55_15170, partial [Flavobacteriaceae bacterium]|nr:hypothetical protein [Flavobacteriaceae bacterium]